jgi:deoxyribodipyrimidine photolyase-related protein
MSDYCGSCGFDHKLRIGEKACPFNYLYWNFILEHEESLRTNPRMVRNLLGLKHLDHEQRSQVKENAHQFLDNMK